MVLSLDLTVKWRKVSTILLSHDVILSRRRFSIQNLMVALRQRHQCCAWWTTREHVS